MRDSPNVVDTCGCGESCECPGGVENPADIDDLQSTSAFDTAFIHPFRSYIYPSMQLSI
jgi:hypothetical protein